MEAEALVSILDYRQGLVMVAKLCDTLAKKKARSVVHTLVDKLTEVEVATLVDTPANLKTEALTR